MKLKPPRYSIGFNLLSIFGWIIMLISLKIFQYGYPQKHPSSDYGEFFVWLFVLIISFTFIIVSFTTYILEIVFDIQFNNKYLSHNKIYSYFFEFGLLLYTFPIIWFIAYSDYTLLPVVDLIGIYVLFKIIQFIIKKIKSDK